MAARKRARDFLDSTDFRQWTKYVNAIAYYKSQGRLDKAVTIEKIDELIEKGEEFKRERKIGHYEKWIQTMFVLKKMRREMESKLGEGK